jgi:hypothetical protein
VSSEVLETQPQLVMKSFSKMLSIFPLAIVPVEPDDSSRSRLSMIFLSFSTVSSFAGLILTDEFTSLDEPTDASRVAAIEVFPADGPDFIGSERQTEPRYPTQNLKFLFVRSIS